MERVTLEDRTAAFATAVFELCQTLRQRPGAGHTIDQLLDAATSIGANYRSSSRSRSRREFVARMAVVAEEADEAVYWLELLDRTRLASAPGLELLLKEAKELRAIFAASYRTARNGRPR